MRVADYIIDYIYRHGTDTIFTLTGGGAMFLNDAVAVHKKMKYVCNHHEQASSYCAEAYAKMKGVPGAVMVTSGPGCTNAISGLMEAYQNSIPVIFISSQAKKSQMIKFSGLHLRQFGVQEVDIIPIVEKLTKFATVVNDPKYIKFYLDCAYHQMLSGRQGPVWLDIPMDVAGAELPKNIKGFKFKDIKVKPNLTSVVSMLKKAKKPLIIAGGGIKSANARKEFTRVVEKFRIPVVVTEMGIDLIEYDHPQYVGHGGIKGSRSGNYAIQNSDLLISLGSRLAPAFTGHEFDKWSPNSKKIVVDIDEEEHRKRTIKIDLFIRSDVKEFLKKLYKAKLRKYDDKWYLFLKKLLPTSIEYEKEKKEVNVYHLVDKISDYANKKDIIVTDAGTTTYCVSQAWKIKKGQRAIIPAATLTMGYNIPAIVGVWSANKKSHIICITGDGSFQSNLQELQVIKHHKIPAKVFVTNNKGYLAIRITQKGYFGNLIGEGEKSGISFPCLRKIADSYNMQYFKIKNPKDLDIFIPIILKMKGSVLCEVITPEWQQLLTVSSKKMPDGKMVSLPIDEMAPFIGDIKEYANKKHL